jgi:hypothetical protein
MWYGSIKFKYLLFIIIIKIKNLYFNIYNYIRTLASHFNVQEIFVKTDVG